MDRALDYGSSGWEFDSLRARRTTKNDTASGMKSDAVSFLVGSPSGRVRALLAATLLTIAAATIVVSSADSPVVSDTA